MCSFKDKSGELAFLDHKFYYMDSNVTYRRWLLVMVDGEYCQLCPLDDIIASVKFTI